MTMADLVTALTQTGYKFTHHAWSKAPEGDYGVYTEDSGNDLGADGKHAERGTEGYLHYFTRDDTSTPRVTIESALNSINIPWYLNNIIYENDTGYIHYEWWFGVYG